MFNIIFGTDLETFINTSNKDIKTTKSNQSPKSSSNLYHTQVTAFRFHRAFSEYEAFSVLKFAAITISELDFIWRTIDKFKLFFNSNILQLTYFSDPMDWFSENFINKHLMLYSDNKEENKNKNKNFPSSDKVTLSYYTLKISSRIK